MSDSEEMEEASVEAGKNETGTEGIASKEKLSIQQILEGMTNEFNKTGTKKQEADKKINRSEPQARNPEKPQTKVVEENTKVIKPHKCISHLEEEIKIIKENIPEKKSDKMIIVKETVTKQETANKKDGNAPPRIVLTFRTIDENTDHGKKTKISSCPSNLSLVPDEFSNCDQIGGVSVKIENFDEVCNVSKSDTEESTVENTEKSDKLANTNKEETSAQEQKTTDKTKLSQENTELKSNSNSEKDNTEKDNTENEKDNTKNEKDNTENEKDSAVDVDKSSKEQKSTPVTRKSRQKRLKELSNASVLKRSARRLSKEHFKSTVLENAMARKEKSNYTTENTKRRYSRPGRPRKHFVEKKAPVPKLNPLDPPKLTPINPSKVVPDKKDAIPKLTPLNPPKIISDKKDNLPKLNPINPPKTVSEKKNNALPKLSPLKLIRSISAIDTNANGSIVNDSQKINKYAGMPKLTPIIKNCEIIKSKFNESSDSNTSLNEDTTSNIVDTGPFHKPAAIKLKRERTKPSADYAKKVAKGNGFIESLSPTNESVSSTEDVIVEENTIPVKRTRRSIAPSPSTADGLASKPESTAVLSKTRPVSKKCESMQCLCEVRSQLFVTITSADSPLYCTALDSVDNRIVGCCNEVDHDDVAMRRPSTRIPYIILCRMHKERLIRHHCCPTCGLFCSQGRFVHCSNGHQYHRGCELFYDDKQLCPHCASYGLSYDVIISMTGKRKPTSATPSKPVPRKEPAAKITLPGAGDNAKLAEQKPAPTKSSEPLISPEIVRIPEPTVVDKSERYTIMSLYTAVKNGELQKLVNVLACGFNANHAFRDQNHRTSLHMAAEKGLLACVHVLVQAGAQLDVLDRNQLSPMMLAAINGQADVVRYLMRIGADVTLKGEDGMTALHMAAKSGHLDVCKVILSECKVSRTLVDSVDDGGWTSLIWACEFRHVDVARFLLENKCDPLIRDAEQNIALHWSAYSGCHEITETLLNLGCDANVVNVHGDTPLHIAARRDQYAVSVLLLSRGARVAEVNGMGETAVDCCTGTGDTLNVLKLNSTVNQQAEHLLEKTVKILTNDITRGKESNPVQCVNGIDLEDKPTDFVYITENCFTSKINVDRTITSLQSCRCEDNCSSDKCLCGNISLRCWYNDEGKLVPEFNYADPPMLFECNPACDCNKIRCNNRVVQHGMMQRFQLFRTDGKGWGLRTLRSISKGSYVCEYVGEIISDSEADLREDDSYLFDLDNRDGETYCIDARRYGNLARFINHSCAPNLLPVRVFIEHQDLHFPRIAFFANRDIEADEELGFDYGEKFWIIKYKSFTCTCGAENCRYSDKTIQITLNNYHQRIQTEEIHTAQPSTA